MDKDSKNTGKMSQDRLSSGRSSLDREPWQAVGHESIYLPSVRQSTIKNPSATPEKITRRGVSVDEAMFNQLLQDRVGAFASESSSADPDIDTMESSNRRINFKRSCSDTTALDLQRLFEKEWKVIQPMRPALLTEREKAFDFDDTKTFGGIVARVKLSRPLSLNETEDFQETLEECWSPTKAPQMREVKIVAFVNSKSGGGIGKSLMNTLQQILCSERGMTPFPRSTSSKSSTASGMRRVHGVICDLSKADEPAHTISSIAEELGMAGAPEMRLVVCGGDGTVTWILSALEQSRELRDKGLLNQLPLAIVPLGTGNDLARSLGWGARLRSVSQILQYLQWVLQAEIVDMDQWQVALRPHDRLPDGHKLREFGSHPQCVTDPSDAERVRTQMDAALQISPGEGRESQDVYVGLCQNYFSIGMTARVAIAVDRSRSETSCGRCFFRYGLGQACYAVQALKAMSMRHFSRRIQNMRVLVGTEESGPVWVPMNPSLNERRVHCASGKLREMMFVNINSMSGGHMALPDAAALKKSGAAPPSPDDDVIEVLGGRNFGSLVLMTARLLQPVHLASAVSVAFSVAADDSCSRQSWYMQLDGEPWRLDLGCDVMLAPHRKVKMLCAPAWAPYWPSKTPREFWHVKPAEPTPTGCGAAIWQCFRQLCGGGKYRA